MQDQDAIPHLVFSFDACTIIGMPFDPLPAALPRPRRPRRARAPGALPGWLAARIVEHFRERALEPGDHITEQALADHFQVSRTPVRMALWTLAATQLMNLAFIVPLKHAGLALAIGLGGCINAALLFRGLRRSGIYRPEAGWGKFAGKLAAALACMTAVLWWSAGDFGWWTTAATSERVVRLGVIVLFGSLAYFLALWLLGFRVADFSRRAEH